MKTKNTKEEKRKESLIDFLKAKKARDGKLNKLGEWLLEKGDTGLYVKDKDMKFILK